MEKSKSISKGFQLSERDKKILWIVGAFMIVFLAYFFGFNKIENQISTYDSQLSSAKSRQRDLAEKNAKRDDYIKDTSDFENKYNAIVSNYANGSSEDSILVFLSNLESITGGWIKSTTFSSITPIYTFGGNNSDASTGTSGKYATDMIGYKTTLTLAYESKYDDIKSLIAYINNYYSKNTIDSVSMSYNEVTGIVSGTMAVSTYCVTGGDRVFEYPNIEKDTGTKNLFKSLSLNNIARNKSDESGNYILSDYDYYMFVNPSTSDQNACMIGKKDDDKGTTMLSTDFNELQKVTIHFSGSDGKYKASYSIGDQKYPIQNFEAGDEFDPGNSMDLLIMSSKRVSDADKSSVNLTLENDSDMNLHVKVYNDDKENPRILFADAKGAVSIYQ